MEVADIIRAYRDAFVASRGGRIPTTQRRILRDLSACRTAALGGHLEQCDRCNYRVIAYNSCRNRHCPKCQASARFHWVADRVRDLLPVEYFHVVFTVPSELAAIALQNKRVIYDILFHASTDTLQTIAADPRHLGAEVGVLAVLHTWGQDLRHHPHIHCIVPGGGMGPEGGRWVACRPGFFLPIKVLSTLFRGKLLAQVKDAEAHGRLSFHGALETLEDPDRFRAYLKPLYSKRWVVYAKPPFGGPAQVLKYLGRYTHRVAIANSRLVEMKEGSVSFLWKDYASGCRRRIMTLRATEFLRRFLLHALPKGFVRIRYYGLMANRCRRKRIARCRELLGVDAAAAADSGSDIQTAPVQPGHPQRCPVCGEGRLVRVRVIQPGRDPPVRWPSGRGAA
jgi:hypothetical protein